MLLTITAAMHDNKSKRNMLEKYVFMNSRITPAFLHVLYLFVCYIIRYILQTKSNQQAFSNLLALCIYNTMSFAWQFVQVKNKWNVYVCLNARRKRKVEICHTFGIRVKTLQKCWNCMHNLT